MSSERKIELIERTEPIDGVWSYWKCSYGEDENGNELIGEIQSDGHLYAIETLTDDQGNKLS